MEDPSLDEGIHDRQLAGYHPHCFVLGTDDSLECGAIGHDRQRIHYQVAANENAIEVDGVSSLYGFQNRRGQYGMTIPLLGRTIRTEMNFEHALSGRRRVFNEARGGRWG